MPPPLRARREGQDAALGFDPFDAGPLSAARDLEHVAELWIRLAYELGNGPAGLRGSRPTTSSAGPAASRATRTSSSGPAPAPYLRVGSCCATSRAITRYPGVFAWMSPRSQYHVSVQTFATATGITP